MDELWLLEYSNLVLWVLGQEVNHCLAAASPLAQFKERAVKPFDLCSLNARLRGWW